MGNETKSLRSYYDKVNQILDDTEENRKAFKVSLNEHTVIASICRDVLKHFSDLKECINEKTLRIDPIYEFAKGAGAEIIIDEKFIKKVEGDINYYVPEKIKVLEIRRFDDSWIIIKVELV